MKLSHLVSKENHVIERPVPVQRAHVQKHVGWKEDAN
jgi:hypothetical protein